jgi:uncharacterized protein (TIGR02118 family)
MVILTVIYPKTSESHFDLDYYLQTHIPLVRSRLTRMGMESIHLMRGTGALDAGLPSFEIIAQLHFDVTPFSVH